MRLALADVLCQSCQGYVHPFLDRCPGCGTPRTSRYAEALGGADLGGASMRRDPTVVGLAVQSIRRTTTLAALHGAWMRGAAVAGPVVEDSVDPARMIDFVTGGVTYRARGLPEARKAATDAQVRVIDDTLVLSAARGGRTLASIPAATILAASPGGRGRRFVTWDGTWADGASMPVTPDLPDGDLLLTHATDRGAVRLGIGNPSGLFASRPGHSHYEELARWIGLLAVAHAEARWTSMGVPAYAAELGLAKGAEVRAAPVDVDREGGAAEPIAPGPATTVHEAMVQLGELRAAGLITEEEYEAKRGEILRRL